MFTPAIFNSPVNKTSANILENNIQTESVEQNIQNEPDENNAVEQNNISEENSSNNQQVLSERDLLILSLDNFIEVLGNFDSYECFTSFVNNGKFKAGLIPDESNGFNNVKILADSLTNTIAEIVENENSQEKISFNVLRDDDNISNQMNDLYSLIVNL